MHILVVGYRGQLGQELARGFTTGAFDIGPLPEPYRNASVDYVDIDSIDITDEKSVDAWFSSHEPYDLIINCAAYTNVDGCEEHFLDAQAVNETGPRLLAQAAAKQDATFIQVSTDYVFSGTVPGERSESDEAAPCSAYGTTKRAGEVAALAANPKTHIARTAWLYGYVGKNFVKTMKRLGQTHTSIQVVDDQFGNPTNANDTAYELLKIAQSEDFGVWHVTNEGTTTWAQFAQAIMDGLELACSVVPITSAQYKELNPQSADRPQYSSLKNNHLEMTVGNEMRSWQEALSTYLTHLQSYDDVAVVE